MKTSILLVEDQFIEADNLRLILKDAGYAVFPVARSVAEALTILEKQIPDIVLLDILLKGEQTGIDLALILKTKNIAFVYISANSDRRVLDLAIQTKPYGFLIKPFRKQDVLMMLDVARYLHQHNRESADYNAMTPAVAKGAAQFPGIIGTSEAMRGVLKNVQRLGPSETSVLILGESGTGKELIAWAIHTCSQRRSGPMIVVNCGALPANLVEAELFGHEKGAFTGATEKRIGKFEQAEGGTIFLDEVGELTLDMQVKLLRFLQEKEIDPIGGKKKKINVRVIAATNRVLEDEVAIGRFRLDLYYRLNVFPIFLPPLRQRRDDILPLAEHFLNMYAHKENKRIDMFSLDVIDKIQEYDWPGNIRELENLVARSVLMTDGPKIESIQIPRTKKNGISTTDNQRLKTMEENERDHIIAILDKCKWRIHGKGGAAELLAMNTSTLYSRIKKLGIIKPEYQPGSRK
jgi:DNA-binding NtrC family response regulator